jgi:hypothetical protein
MVGISGNSNPTWLGWMLVLAMTAAGGNKIPTIIFDCPDYITNLHSDYSMVLFIIVPTPHPLSLSPW